MRRKTNFMDRRPGLLTLVILAACSACPSFAPGQPASTAEAPGKTTDQATTRPADNSPLATPRSAFSAFLFAMQEDKVAAAVDCLDLSAIDEEQRRKTGKEGARLLFNDIKRLAVRLGVEFAFPTQTIHLYQETAGERSASPPLDQAHSLGRKSAAAIVRETGLAGTIPSPVVIDPLLSRGEDTDGDDQDNGNN